MPKREPRSLAERMLNRPPGANVRAVPDDPDPAEFPPAKLPPAPKHLDAAAKKEWKRVGNELLNAGRIGELDVAMFAIYCQAVSRLAKAERELADLGELVRSPSGYALPSPWLAIQATAAKQIETAVRMLELRSSG